MFREKKVNQAYQDEMEELLSRLVYLTLSIIHSY